MTGQWFSPDIPVSSTNKTDCHDIIEILLKVALNTINQTKPKFIEISSQQMFYQYILAIRNIYMVTNNYSSQYVLENNL